VARFAEAGKGTSKKDLGMMMMTYGYVYVASISMGYNKNQALQAIMEAEAYPGPAIIIAYAPCINHGIDMSQAMKHEKKAVETGYWLLYRYNPLNKAQGKSPLTLDSKEPNGDVLEFIESEKRYSSINKVFPERVKEFRTETEAWIKNRYEYYKKLSQ
jgi:pyruvate-ferredoxin/flavodoxin oxidoreductase